MLGERVTETGLVESGTQGNRPAPLDKVSRSRTNKMRLRDTGPRKRMKLYIRYYVVEFHVDSRSNLVEGLCFFS